MLPAPDLADAWTWLAEWWRNDYLPRHPAIALREAMSAVANMQESSVWRFDTEIVAWDLLHDRIDESTGCWFGNNRHLPQVRDKLQQLHPLVSGWWIEGGEDDGWEPIFIDAAAWEARRREKWGQS